MIAVILKAILVGICAAIPIGPIAILVLSKCLNKGRRSGVAASLGSVTVDAVYTIVAVFALAIFQNFMDLHRDWVSLGGGIILIIVGASMAFRNPYKAPDKITSNEKHKYTASIGDYFQAILLGFSNIGAIFVIFGLFAFFGVCDGLPHDWRVAPIVIAEAAGEMIWWLLFTYVASRFHGKLSIAKMIWANRFMGIILAILGLAFFADGIFRFCYPAGGGLI